ncbi:MAG: GTP-binding protein [Candidatus Hodarchaeales archaeon]|jgi:small GTP-binding protein
MATIAKIVLLGDGAVGKTSLRQTFMGKHFTDKYQETIGADFSMKTVDVSVDEKQYSMKFQIWDLAGQQKFQTVRSVYYNGVRGVLVVFDLTRPETLENCKNWLADLRDHFVTSTPPPVVLLGNKVDLRKNFPTALSSKEGQALAQFLPADYCNNMFDIPYYETSAKTGEMVEKAFLGLGEHIIKIRNQVK